MPSPEELVSALMRRRGDTAVEFAPDVSSAFARKGWFTPRDTVYLGGDHVKVPAVLAHELGHAQFNKTQLGSVLQHPALVLATNHLGTPMSGLAGLLAARSDSSVAPYAAALVPLAMHAPTLVSEAMASRNAMAKLREAGASVADLAKARRQLSGAYGSYLGQAALSGMATAAPLLVRRYWRKREAEKNAAKKEIGVFEGAPSTRPVLQRSLQGALAGSGLGALSAVAMVAMAPEIVGIDNRKRLTRTLAQIAGMGAAGAGIGGTLGAYEAARFQGEEPPTLSTNMWLAGRLGMHDRTAK